MKLITRNEYINGKHTHEEYYGQFVTQRLVDAVKRAIGEDEIKKSKCTHFNDISYNKKRQWLWDEINSRCYIDIKKWAMSGMGVATDSSYVEEYTGTYVLSLADNTCICKSAARIIRGELINV